MGCGASIPHAGTEKPGAAAAPTGFSLFARRGKPRPEAGPLRTAAAPAPAPAAGIRRLTTPPVGTQRGRPSGYEGLRIEAAPHATPSGMLSRERGMAETPMGKLAEEYKFFCPLCMMFYKNIREVPCCKQYICTSCLGDFLDTKQPSPPPVATGEGGGRPAEPAPRPRPPPEGVIPSGVACPHCATISEGKPLRLLDSNQEARSYVDSPTTKADLARQWSSMSGNGSAHSPLKVGDDFQTMARKMLPFYPPCEGDERGEGGRRGEGDEQAADADAAAVPASCVEEVVAGAQEEAAQEEAGPADATAEAATDPADGGEGA